MAKHYVGDTIELVGEFRDPATRALVDPTTTICTVKKPDGGTFTPSTTRESLGIFTAQASAANTDQEGEYVGEFKGTGANAGLDQFRYFVHPSGIV